MTKYPFIHVDCFLFIQITYHNVTSVDKCTWHMNNILKDNMYDYILLDDFEGFNMAKSKWVNMLIFKLKE